MMSSKSVGCSQVWHLARRRQNHYTLYHDKVTMTDFTNTRDSWTQWEEDESGNPIMSGRIMFCSERNELPISLRLKTVKLLEPAQLLEEERIVQGKPRNINDAEELLRIDDPAIVSVTKMDALSMAMKINDIPIAHQGKTKSISVVIIRRTYLTLIVKIASNQLKMHEST